MNKRKGYIAPQNGEIVSQALRVEITGGKAEGVARTKKQRGGNHRAAYMLVLDMSIAGPPSCKRKGRSSLGRVALDFVNPKSILETNNGLGMNLTNPAFRQTENLTNFPEREFFVVIQGHNHALSFRESFDRPC